MAEFEVDADSVDFAVAAWREEGRWAASAMPARIATNFAELTSALRRLPGEGGVFALVGVAEELLLIVRQQGDSARIFINDGACILDWSLAEEAVDAADLPWEEEELEEYEPFGDLGIFADFGFDATEMGLLCSTEDTYPDEQAKAIAKQVGFGEQFAEALRSA